MGCLPESGNCERPHLEPFVGYINAVESSCYRHVTCLDVRIRNSPQPEALYADPRLGQMVIERKCLVWPAEYAARHRADHALTDRLYDLLPKWALDGPYVLRLSGIRPDSKREIEAAARHIAHRVSEAGPLDSETVALEGSGCPDWYFCRRPADDSDEYASPDRLSIVLPMEMVLAPRPIPKELVAGLERVLAAAKVKFREYQDDRCVVLVDPQGSIAHAPTEWWLSLVNAARLPGVNELWVAQWDFADPDGQYHEWFDRIVPPSVDSEGCA